jgi:hypothetical protein
MSRIKIARHLINNYTRDMQVGDSMEEIEDLDRKNLIRYRKMISGLTQRVEDRTLENTADLMEMQYLQWETDQIIDRMKIRAIDKRNDKLVKKDSTREYVGHNACDISEPPTHGRTDEMGYQAIPSKKKNT